MRFKSANVHQISIEHRLSEDERYSNIHLTSFRKVFFEERFFELRFIWWNPKVNFQSVDVARMVSAYRGLFLYGNHAKVSCCCECDLTSSIYNLFDHYLFFICRNIDIGRYSEAHVLSINVLLVAASPIFSRTTCYVPP